MAYCVAAFSFMRLPCRAAGLDLPCGPLNLCLLKMLPLPRRAPAFAASASMSHAASSGLRCRCTAARAAGLPIKKGPS